MVISMVDESTQTVSGTPATVISMHDLIWICLKPVCSTATSPKTINVFACVELISIWGSSVSVGGTLRTTTEEVIAPQVKLGMNGAVNWVCEIRNKLVLIGPKVAGLILAVAHSSMT